MERRVIMNGKIIAISGMDASGKSTVVDYIIKEFEKYHVKYILTKQPIPCIKEWDCFKELLKKESESLEYSTIGGLVSWGRLNTQIREVIPALNDGYYVLCERYILDIIAWSYFRGANEEHIMSWVSPLLKEDFLFYCNSQPEVIYRRLLKRNGKFKIGEDSLDNVSEIVHIYKREAQKRKAISINTGNDFYSNIEYINYCLGKVILN